MKKISLIIASLTLVACAGQPRSDNNQADVYKLLEQFTERMEAYPKLEEGKSCKALIRELDIEQYEILEITENKVTAQDAAGVLLNYNVKEGGCL